MYMTSDKTVKLHLGCGNIILDGYTNIDIVPGEGIDVVSDVRSLPMYKDASVDEVYLSHVLEHFSWKDTHWGIMMRHSEASRSERYRLMLLRGKLEASARFHLIFAIHFWSVSLLCYREFLRYCMKRAFPYVCG